MFRHFEPGCLKLEEESSRESGSAPFESCHIRTWSIIERKCGEVCISELPLSTCIPKYPSPLILRVNGMGAKGPWRLDEVVVEVAEAEKTYPEGTKPMQCMEFPGNSEK